MGLFSKSIKYNREKDNTIIALSFCPTSGIKEKEVRSHLAEHFKGIFSDEMVETLIKTVNDAFKEPGDWGVSYPTLWTTCPQAVARKATSADSPMLSVLFTEGRYQTCCSCSPYVGCCGVNYDLSYRKIPDSEGGGHTPFKFVGHGNVGDILPSLKKGRRVLYSCSEAYPLTEEDIKYLEDRNVYALGEKGRDLDDDLDDDDDEVDHDFWGEE